MSARTKWKTVIDGNTKTHTSENKTYEFLRAWASESPDGAKVTVFVQDPGRDVWSTFERHIVRGGVLAETF